jgi:hypothetical protein
MTDSTPMAHITITFNNGVVQVYAVTEQQLDGLQLASRVKSMMAASMVALEVEDRLVMLPMANIRMIEVSPSPTKLPDTVIRHVVPLE